MVSVKKEVQKTEIMISPELEFELESTEDLLNPKKYDIDDLELKEVQTNKNISILKTFKILKNNWRILINMDL